MKLLLALKIIAIGVMLTVGVLSLSGCILDNLFPEPIPDPPPVVVDPEPDNAPPITFEPLVLGSGGWREITPIDLRLRLHGCDSTGLPLWKTGAFDPDGDLLEYWIQITGPNNVGALVKYSVFDVDGNRIDGRWLPVDYFDMIPCNGFDANSELEQNALVYTFLGHTGDEPYHDIRVFGPLTCDPPGEDPPDPEDPPAFGTWLIVYSVRDPNGGIATAASSHVVFGIPCTD